MVSQGEEAEDVVRVGGWTGSGMRLILGSIASRFTVRRRYSHSIDFWADNHEKYTAVSILIDRLMIPLYQTNAHNNTVRKNVSGLAVMGMLLGLLHKFCLDLLSTGNLAEHVPAISKW